MRFLVTGATGFIGTHLCHRLVKDGHEVIALVRNPEKAEALPTTGVHILNGDLSLFKDPELKLPACDVIVHLAGVISARCQQEYRAVNYDAVVDLVQCLLSQSWRPKRFVFASTLAAGGPSQPSVLKTEQDEDEPVEAYGRSKLDAEHYLKKVAPCPVTSFRPGAVFGPGDPAFLTVFRMAARGWGIRVAGRDPQFSYIYVDDLVEAIIPLLMDAASGHKTYYTVYPEPSTINTMWNILSETMQHKIRVAPIPAPLLFAAMLGSTAASKVLPYKNQLDLKQYRQLTAPAFICSSQALQDDFQWRAGTDLARCIQQTTAAYREAGWL